jgi:tRNA (adenine-N(1)-)-methyltransferase non-catalytic subunit
LLSFSIVQKVIVMQAVPPPPPAPPALSAAASPLAAAHSYQFQGGDRVLILLNDEHWVFAVLKPGSSAKIQKGQCKLDAVIGAPHGSYFQVDRNQLHRIDAKPQLRADDDLVTAANNKDLVDDNTAQKLSKEEIDEMKKTGKTGEEIIRALVDNSDTFKTKTVFSQEKYLKKKQKKHLPFVQVLYPSVVNLVRAYESKNPQKIIYLRQDSLAQMLTLSNVQAGMKVIVVDAAHGLLTGAVLERMGGLGHLLNLYCGHDPCTSILSQYNFPPSMLDIVTHHPLYEALLPPSSIAAMTTASPKQLAAAGTPAEADAKASAAAAASATQLREQLADAESLLIACKHEPSEILPRLLQYLAPSASFVIWSSNLQALSQAYMLLIEERCYVKLQLSETWMRQYQVLPGRTHPHMSMHGASGYILTGIKLASVSVSSAAAAPTAAAPMSAATQANKRDSAAEEPAAKRSKTIAGEVDAAPTTSAAAAAAVII